MPPLLTALGAFFINLKNTDMNKFTKGDVVRLKSGGNKMVVLGYKENNAAKVVNYYLGEKKYQENENSSSWVLCEWMVKSKRQTGWFEEANIELVDVTNE